MNKKPPAGPLRVAVVVKSSRGQNQNLKSRYAKVAPSNPDDPDGKNMAVSRTASVRSQGSEGGGPLKDNQDVPEGVEIKVEETEEQTRKTSVMRPSEQKPHSPVWVRTCMNTSKAL